MKSEISLAESCPVFQTGSVTSDAIITKIDACIEARKTNTENTIEEYSCPSGDFSWEDNMPLTNERIAYMVTTNILMNEADKQVKEYMKKLQDARNKDAVAWTQNINTCLYGKGGKGTSLTDIYAGICQFSYVQHFLNNNSSNRLLITTTDTYPQTVCNQVAQKKLKAWEGLGYNLMQDGIHKGFQNDHDTYVTKLTAQYQMLLDQFHRYQRIITRASSKIRVYIRNAIK